MDRWLSRCVLCLLVAGLPSIAHAMAFSVSSPWRYGELVTVTGDNLDGDHTNVKQVCVAPEAARDRKTCYYDTTLDAERWDEAALTFYPPVDVPPRGTLSLRLWIEEEQCFGSAGCDEYGDMKDITVGDYVAEAHIDGVLDLQTMEIPAALEPGHRYAIVGSLFGSDKGKLFLKYARISQELPQAVVSSWSPELIEFTMPEDVEATTAFSVNNGGMAGSFELKGAAQMSSSSRSVSSSSASSRKTSSSLSSRASTSFPDVHSSPNRTAIEGLASRLIIGGYPDGTFRPLNTINRAELLKILVGGTGAAPSVDEYHDCFPDVGTEWFAPFVCYAKIMGWVTGYPDGSFKPWQTVNTVEAIKMIVGAQGFLAEGTLPAGQFDDVDLGAWYAPYLAVAWDKGLLESLSGTLGVRNDMTRGSVAETIYRAVVIREEGLERFGNASERRTSSSPASGAAEGSSVTTMSLNMHWTNWDGDAEDDGFELSPFFQDTNGALVYPKKKDWIVTVSISNGESDYDRYGDFFTHRTNLVNTLEFDVNDVKYEQYLVTPFVRVRDEDMSGLDVGDGQFIIEATFTSPTVGSFSATTEWSDWRSH